MLRICISLFITGIILGTGPCLTNCGPILISYIAATKRSAMEGLWSWFIFSTSRIFVYIFLGFIAGFAGTGLFQNFYWELPGYIIWFVSGIFILSLSILILFGKDTHFKVCRVLNESLIQKDTKSLVTLGILIGIFPCIPLIGVLSYITMVSVHFTQGILLGASFGLGTLISPLIFLGMAAGAIPRLKILQKERYLVIFQRLWAATLFFLGLHIIIKTIVEYIKTL